jgi:hypothetical protein
VPSRKQRRRRLKERRHEYEYVYVDEEGREVEPPEEAEEQAPARGKSASGRRAAATTRAGRRIEPPSWNRVGKRALFIGPVMFLLINLLGKNLSVAQRIYQTAVLLVIFLPFSYFMDSLMYRSYLKRTGAAPPPKRRGSNERRGSNGAA